MSKRLQPPQPVDRELAWTPGPRTDRARQRILDAAQRVFLERGYAGARVGDITAAAGLSRASFYIYFPSKYDVFLALGVDSAAAGARRVSDLDAIPKKWTDDDLRVWLAGWFDHLERFGAFERLWRQEAPDDLRAQGLDAERRAARNLGRALARLRDEESGDPLLQGISLHALVEGLWYFHRRAPQSATRHEVVEGLVDTVKLLIVPQPEVSSR